MPPLLVADTANAMVSGVRWTTQVSESLFSIATSPALQMPRMGFAVGAERIHAGRMLGRILRPSHDR